MGNREVSPVPGWFTAITDQQPLVSILNGRNMDAISNQRIQRIVAKLVGYDFRLLWTPGKTQIIADALSRSPVFPAEEEPDILVCTVRAARTSNKEALLDPALARLIQTAKEDEDYQSVYEAIDTFKEVHKLPDGHPAQMFKMHWHTVLHLLSIDFP